MFGRLYVLPVIAEFLAQYPLISVRLLLGDRNVHLVDDDVDMAVRIGALPDSSLVASHVGLMRTVICGSLGLFARHGTPQAPEDLQGLPAVEFDMFGLSSGWRFHDLDGSLRPAAISLTPRLVVTTAEAALEAAVMSVGVTRLLHYQTTGAIAAGKLKIVLAKYEPPPLPVHLVHAARGQMPLKMRRFIDFAAPRLRARLDDLNEADASAR
jgi:DNA-binding transcriptional LysR family regulator